MNEIPQAFNELFKDVERAMLPFMRSRVQRYKGMDVDDAIQEARIALMKAMSKYDFDKASGKLVPYMREVVANTYRASIAKALSQKSCPRVAVRGEHGWVKAPQMPMSYEALMEARAPIERGREEDAAEHQLDVAQREALMEQFKRALFKKLSTREQDVLRCRLAPPEALEELAGEDEIKNVHIAEHLGLDKSKIDWALYKIRNVFTELAQHPKYAELFGGFTESRAWPRIHVTRGTRPRPAFVARTLKAQRLMMSPIGVESDERCELGRRCVEFHTWGAIMTVERDGEVWTCVIEGTFNPRAGEVTGALGARLLVPIDGYGQLARALAA